MTDPRRHTVRDQELAPIRKRFLLASTLGAIVAVLLFAVILQSGRDGLFSSDLLGNFYDGQTRAIFDGHLDVDPAIPGFEGFRIGDKTFLYQGLTPVLLRMPLLALTSSLDGRLTGVSMLLAMCVAMAYVVAASWRVRVLLRGPTPLRRAEFALTAVGTFALGTGSILFLASRAWVYHEAQLWGVALSLGSLTHLVYWLTTRSQSGPLEPARPAGRGWTNLIAAVALAGLALNTRTSIALGPFAALGATGLMVLVEIIIAGRDASSPLPGPAARLFRLAGWPQQRRSSGPAGASSPSPVTEPDGSHSEATGLSRNSQASRGTVRGGVAALLIIGLGLSAGLAFYASVNHARFGSAFGVPLERQLLVENDPNRLDALNANNGSLFGLKYAPSVAVALLRPDALSIRPAFPYLGFPDERPAVIGSAVFAERDWSSSVPASQPLLFLAAIAGLVALFAPKWMLGDEVDQVDPDAGGQHTGDVRLMRIPVYGSAVGAAAILVFGYMAQRYVSDLYPFLVLGSIVGLHAVARRLESRSAARGPVGVTFAVVVVVTSLWGAWANSAIALQYGREIAPGFTAVGRGSWLELQLRLPGSVPHIGVDSIADLPGAAPKGTVAIVGDCEALYRSTGSVWYLVESGSEGGSFRVKVSSGDALGEPLVIASAQAKAGRIELSVAPISGGRATLEFPGTLVAAKAEFDLDPDPHGGFNLDLDVVHDELDRTITVIRHGTRHELLRTIVDATDLQPATDDRHGPAGKQGAPESPPKVVSSRLATPLCHKLLGG